MKKQFIVLLTIIFILVFCACDKKDNTGSNQEQIPTLSTVTLTDDETQTSEDSTSSINGLTGEAQTNSDTTSNQTQTQQGQTTQNTQAQEQNTESVASQNESVTDTTSSQSSLVDRENAITIALKKAGLKYSEVRDLEAEIDHKGKTTCWEVEFESKGFKYSYDIDAKTGEILRSEKERDD